MKLLIHDRKEINSETVLKDCSEETVFISDNGKIHPCMGCFGCWVKTPGQCVIKDGYENMGLLVSKCNQLIIISQCFYGGYSPFVKNVLDRTACPCLLPYFKIKNGETHHPVRYKNDIELFVCFYGTISEAEKETAQKLIKANGINLFTKTKICFYNSFEEIKGL
jgi:multimeric flavodoxin WrbA